MHASSDCGHPVAERHDSGMARTGSGNAQVLKFYTGEMSVYERVSRSEEQRKEHEMRRVMINKMRNMMTNCMVALTYRSSNVFMSDLR